MEQALGRRPGSVPGTAPGLPLVMVSHAAYPAVTRDKTPASLSKKWISDILRKKIGYRGLIASDDLEMGGVLAAAAIEQAAVEYISAGGDLCLICHKEEFVSRAYAELVRRAEGEREFGRRVAESAKRVLAFKKKWTGLRSWAKAPTDVGRAKAVAATLGVRRASSAGRHPPAGDRLIVAGVMSGTSADGIDVALMRVTEAETTGRSERRRHSRSRATQTRRGQLQFRLLGHGAYPYSKAVRTAVLAAMNASLRKGVRPGPA